MTEREAIEQRVSVRTFLDQQLNEEAVRTIDEWLADAPKAPFGTPLHFALIPTHGDEGEKKIGTYGFIKNASHFLAGTVNSSAPKGLEDYAFVMEKAILFLTALGFATCWLGASFRKSHFADRLKPADGEIIPAVSPVGLAAGQLRLQEKIGSKIYKPRTRKPMSDLFFSERMGKQLTGTADQLLPFEWVRLAPSARNKQPWRILVQGASHHFYIDRAPGMRKKDQRLGVADLERLDLGIAMAHFDMGVKALGGKGTWLVEQPGLEDLPGSYEYLATFFRE